MFAAALGPLLNHLWQSTVFVFVAGLLVLVLRNGPARVRYWFWLMASLKFLVPFVLLVSIGSHVEWRTAQANATPAWSPVIEHISRPFLIPIPSVHGHPASLAPAASPIPFLLFVLWLCGFIAVALSYGIRWRRVYLAKRRAYPLHLSVPINAFSSPALVEPAIFGILRPSLILPEGITGHLTPVQLDTVFAHELCHARRHDNLTAVLHIVVEAVFWFHPLVWWLGAKLVEERERACDEAVVQAGKSPQVYAEAILEVCKFYLASPLSSAAGVSGGANLKKRIERIMTASVGPDLTRRARLLLAFVVIAAVAVPILTGLAAAPPRQGSPSKAHHVPQTIKSATVALSSGGGRPTVSESPHQVAFKNATLRRLVRMAYGGRYFQVVGGPDWITSTQYDINAKLEGVPSFEHLWMSPLSPALQTFLKERFKLQLHPETRELPVYVLTSITTGLRLQKSNLKTCENFQWDLYPLHGTRQPDYCGVIETGPNKRLNHTLDAVGMPIEEVPGKTPGLSTVLSRIVGRPVIDKTGLSGLFNMRLEWNVDATTAALESGDLASTRTANNDSPSLFLALKQQLGLKLQAGKGPVQVLVIDHAEKPSLN